MFNLGFINNATKTLGDALGAQQRPLVLMAAKYWWVALPVALAIWGKVKERRAEGKLQTHYLVGDVGAIITPAISLILLSEFVISQQTGTPPPPGAAGLGKTIDAAFIPNRTVPMGMPRGAAPIPQADDNPMSSILGGY